MRSQRVARQTDPSGGNSVALLEEPFSFERRIDDPVQHKGVSLRPNRRMRSHAKLSRAGVSTCKIPRPGSSPRAAAARRALRDRFELDIHFIPSELKRIFGVDLTKIPGIRVGIGQTLFGEIGPDFTKFRSASAFASWMGYLRTTISAAAKCFGSAHERSTAEPRRPFEWPPSLSTTAGARSVISTDV
jgi:hypothetical protein